MVKPGMKITYRDKFGPVPAIVMSVEDDAFVKAVDLYAIGEDAREGMYSIEDDIEYDGVYSQDEIVAGKRHDDKRNARMAYCLKHKLEQKTINRHHIEVFAFEFSPAEMNAMRNAR